MKTLHLAFRNLFRQKRRSIFLAVAVALGFSIILLLSGLLAGLLTSFKQNLSQSLGGHVFLRASEYNAYGSVVSMISHPDELEAAVAELGPLVQDRAMRSSVEATVIFGSKSIKAEVSGVPWAREQTFRDSLMPIQGSVSQVSGPRLILGQTGAEKLGLAAGDLVLVKFATLDGQMNVLDFTVAAVIKDTGGASFDEPAYADLAQVNRMLGLPEDGYQSLSLSLRSMEDQVVVARQLEKSLATVAKVKPREESNDSFLKLFQTVMGETGDTEKWAGPKYSVSILNDLIGPLMPLVTALQSVRDAIFLLLLGITAIGISNSFRMILRERFKEVGTLRALGMRRHRVRNLFLLEAVLLVAAGMMAGGLLAAVLGGILQSLSLAGQDLLLLFLKAGRLQIQSDLGSILLTCSALLCAGLLAAWGPARTAAELNPADALRANS